MAKAKRVQMRHPKLSEQRSKKQEKKVDVAVEVREDQVPIHEKSGWERVEKASARAAAKTTEKEA